LLVALVALTLGAAGNALAQFQPDLAVTFVGTDPAEPDVGEEVQIVAEIDNQGSGSASGFEYNFTLNGAPFGENQTYDQTITSDTDPIRINATMNWTAEVGEHRLGSTIDPDDGLQGDDNPDNDERFRDIELGPDLGATNLEADPANPLEGETVTFTVDVENEGNRTAGTFDVELAIDGSSVDTKTVEGLGAGNTTELEMVWVAQSDEHDVAIRVDVDDEVTELDEDNVLTSTIDVRKAQPDLRLGNLTVRPDPPVPGEPAEISVTIVNDGLDPSTNNTIRLASPTVDEPDLEVPELEADQSATASWRWQAESGQQLIDIEVDVGDEVVESDEDNNRLTSQFEIGPDLKLESVGVRPSNPNASDRVQFTATVVNQGSPTDETVNVALSVDNETLEAQPLQGLQSNQPQTVATDPWVAQPGEHELVGLVDPEDAIAETDEDNNILGDSFTVGEPDPDLTVRSAVLSPDRPEAGNETSIIAQVENVGLDGASDVEVTATIDGSTIADATIDPLEEGAEETVTLGNWTAREGLHDLTITVDADDRIDEADEENNTFTRRVGIGLDLALEALVFAPTDPTPGDEVPLQVTAVNNGTQRTSQTEVAFEADGREVARASVPDLEPGDSTTATANWTASTADELSARIDPADEFVELDEENNRARASVSTEDATGPVDLTILALTWDDEAIESDQQTQFVARVANVGTAASQATSVSFTVDGTSLGSDVDVTSLAAGDVANVTSPAWNVTDGEHELEATVDPTGDVAETNDLNNTKTATVSPGPTGVPGPGLVAVLALAGASAAARRRTR
jgi:subtilase family serine protease